MAHGCSQSACCTSIGWTNAHYHDGNGEAEAAGHRRRDWNGSFPLSSPDLLEVEISQIHVAIRQDVYGENIFPFAETNLEKLLSQIPVVPLAPGHGVCRIIGGPDLKRACFVRSVHID